MHARVCMYLYVYLRVRVCLGEYKNCGLSRPIHVYPAVVPWACIDPHTAESEQVLATVTIVPMLPRVTAHRRVWVALAPSCQLRSGQAMLLIASTCALGGRCSSGQDSWTLSLAPAQWCHVASSYLLPLSVPQFPQQLNGAHAGFQFLKELCIGREERPGSGGKPEVVRSTASTFVCACMHDTCFPPNGQCPGSVWKWLCNT